MKQLKLLALFLSLLLASQGTLQAQNINPNVYYYTSMAEATGVVQDTNAIVHVSEASVGGTFAVRRRSLGYSPDGATVIACADSLNVLVRDVSQATGVNLSWFLKPINGTDTTDNYAKLQWLFSPACPFNHFIWDKAGAYYTTRLPDVQKYIKVEGPDGAEVPTNTVYLYVPQATTALTFNNANSAGSYLRGFGIYSKLPESGRILEYNAANGTMLYIAPLFTLTAGKTFEFRDSYFPDKVKGTAVISNAGTANIAAAVTYYSLAGTFAVGDTVKGVTSGAKAAVRFVSKIYNALAVGTVTGNFIFGESITGTTSGATAHFYSIPAPSRWQFAKVATISNTTGSLDNPGGNVVDTTLDHADTLQYNVSGTLDSLGASGKRTNIFTEAGKYSVGVVVNRRITMEDMTVTGFGGDGIYITSATTPVSNANLTRLNRVRSNANAGNGVRIYSGDANHISIENSTLVNNAGWGICNMSFLGSSEDHNHVSVNMVGGYTSGTYINRKTVYENPYTEGAYNSMFPWQPAENVMGGGSVKIGGTDGLTNNTPYWSTAGNGGAEYGNHLRNNEFYTDLSNSHDPVIVLKSTGGITHNIAVENQGTPSVGRGGMYTFRSPFGAGYQGADIKNAALYMGGLLGSQATGSTYGVDFFLRRNVPPAMTVTGGSGTGAVLQVEILNGKALQVNVLAGGKKYPLNGTTVTAANFPNTTFIPYIEDSVIKAVIIQGDSLTSNGDNDIYSVAQILSNGTVRPTVNKGGSLGDATHHWAVVYADSIVSAGSASNQYIWNQKTALQPADLNIGTTGSIITNNSAVAATLNPNITNPGLMAMARAGADGYYSPFQVQQNLANSGMHFSAWGSNNTSIAGGGYYRQLANGILGGYYFLDNQISNITFSNGTIHYLLGNSTAGNIGTLTDVGNIDTTGTMNITPKASAADGFVIRRLIGANTTEYRCCGVDGRTVSVLQNGVLANLNYSANQVVYNSTLKIGAQKALVFTSYDGTNTGYGVFNTDASGNFNMNINNINAINITSTGRSVFGGPATLKSYTVATLPSAFTGDIVVVTDALNPVNGQQVAGGGTAFQPVYRTPSQWIVMGANSFWQRAGTTLRPATAGDNVTVDKILKVGSVATGNTTAMDVMMYNPADSSVNRVSTGNFLSANHPQTTGSAPAVAGGTNVTASMNSTAKDAKFQLTLTVAAGGTTGTVATVTFNSAWTQAPAAVFSPANAAAAGVSSQLYADAASSTTLTVSTTGTLAAGTYTFNFIVLQ